MDWIDARYVKGDKPGLLKKLNALGDLAKEMKCTQAQLCLAWCLVNKDVSVAVMGASKPEQVVDNLGALEVMKRWTPEVDKKFEEIMGSAPAQPLNWRTWTPLPPRRSVSVQYPAPEKK